MGTAPGANNRCSCRIVYEALFKAASETLLQIGLDDKHLGAQLGFLAVLHTWGQTLTLHPHLHCIVPGGGLSKDGTTWVSASEGFFLPVRVLSEVFRGKLLGQLKRLHRKGKLSRVENFSRLLDDLYRKKWVVYAKRPFGGPEQVLRYLARYTHRVAISDHRLVDVTAKGVTFRYKDYRRGNEQRLITLSGPEFLRRFTDHILPRGLVRIRSFGFLANCHREKKLALIRSHLDDGSGEKRQAEKTEGDHESDGAVVNDARLCPVCGMGVLLHAIELPPALRDTS